MANREAGDSTAPGEFREDYSIRDSQASPQAASLYVIEARPGLIKIGVAKAPSQRLQALQTGHYETLQLVATFPVENAFAMERALHLHFADKRVRGEWFSVTRTAVDEAVGALRRRLPLPDCNTRRAGRSGRASVAPRPLRQVTEFMSFRLPAPVKATLKQMAQNNGQSLTGFVVETLHAEAIAELEGP